MQIIKLRQQFAKLIYNEKNLINIKNICNIKLNKKTKFNRCDSCVKSVPLAIYKYKILEYSKK